MVAVDQGIVEVETAKAVVEVPVPFAGRVTELHGQPGDVVSMLWKLLSTSSRRAAMSRVRTSRTMSVSPDTRAACSTSGMATSRARRPFQAGWAIFRYT